MVAVSLDRKSTRLNSSHTIISYAVFCLKKKKNTYHSGYSVLGAGCRVVAISWCARCPCGGTHTDLESVRPSSVFHVFPFVFFFNDTATTEIYTLSLHDALPI